MARPSETISIELSPAELALVQRALEDWFQEWSGVAWPPVTAEMAGVVEKFDLWQRTRDWVMGEFHKQQGAALPTG